MRVVSDRERVPLGKHKRCLDQAAEIENIGTNQHSAWTSIILETKITDLKIPFQPH